MADKKIYDLDLVADVRDSDVLYLVRGTGAGADKQFTAQSLKNYTSNLLTLQTILPQITL